MTKVHYLFLYLEVKRIGSISVLKIYKCDASQSAQYSVPCTIVYLIDL